MSRGSLFGVGAGRWRGRRLALGLAVVLLAVGSVPPVASAGAQAAGTPGVVPVAPFGVSALSSDVSVTVSWVVPAQPGVYLDEMFLERVVDDGDGDVVVWSGLVIDDWDLSAESLWSKTVGGLEAGVEYRFRVRLATTGHGDVFSETVTVSVQSEPPVAPEGLAASVGDDGQVSLSWTIPAQPGWVEVGRVMVERRDTGGEAHFSAVADVGWERGTTSYSATDESPRRGLPYAYRVRMLAGGRFIASDTLWVTVPAQVETAAGPLAGFSLVDASDQSLVQTLADGGRVLLRNAADGDFTVRADIADGRRVGSVYFELTGPVSTSRTESWLPYALYGDAGTDSLYGGGPLPEGEYTLTATAYSLSYRRGDTLGTLEATFDVVEDTRGALAAAVLQLTRATVGTSSRSTDADGGDAGGATLRFDRGWARQATTTTTAATTTTTEAPMTTSIVYVVDDSGSMDFGFPEVRTALEAVSDETMANTKVALISFGSQAKTMFSLTAHSSAPWDSHINDFSGRRGGSDFGKAIVSARDMLIADTADVKKIIFLSDGQQDSIDSTLVETLKTAGIAVDTIAFGEELRYDFDRISNFERLQQLSTDTGGTFLGVKKPTSATDNDPFVSSTALLTILTDAVTEDTATLFLVDGSRSMSGSGDSLSSLLVGPSITAAALKAGSTPGAQVGMAQFLGHFPTAASSTDTDLSQAYRIGFEIASSFEIQTTPGPHWIPGWSTGSSNVDHGLKEALSTVNSASPTNKRVVLITDGITEEAVKATTLASYANDSNVTLDVVAWGDHADRAAMKGWADAAGGNYYVAEWSYVIEFEIGASR